MSSHWVRRSRIRAWGASAVALAMLASTGGASASSHTTCDGIPATIVGTAGDDILVGTPGPDVIVGLGGDDTLIGRAGDDHLCGGAGNDVLLGNTGDDVLFGVRGRTRCREAATPTPWTAVTATMICWAAPVTTA